MHYLKSIAAIVLKDLKLEYKSKEILLSMLVFSLLTVVVFSFIYVPGSDAKFETAGGIFWMSVIFAGILGLNKAMMNETDGDNFSAIMMAPIDRTAFFFGKVISNFVFITMVEIAVLPAFSVLYGINFFAHSFMLLVIAPLVSLGFSVTGTLFSVMSVKTKTREIMLPILLLPILVPVILAGISATNIYLGGIDMAEAGRWIRLLIFFDAVYISVIFVVFGFIAEE